MCPTYISFRLVPKVASLLRTSVGEQIDFARSGIRTAIPRRQIFERPANQMNKWTHPSIFTKNSTNRFTQNALPQPSKSGCTHFPSTLNSSVHILAIHVYIVFFALSHPSNPPKTNICYQLLWGWIHRANYKHIACRSTASICIIYTSLSEANSPRIFQESGTPRIQSIRHSAHGRWGMRRLWWSQRSFAI